MRQRKPQSVPRRPRESVASAWLAALLSVNRSHGKTRDRSASALDLFSNLRPAKKLKGPSRKDGPFFWVGTLSPLALSRTKDLWVPFDFRSSKDVIFFSARQESASDFVLRRRIESNKTLVGLQSLPRRDLALFASFRSLTISS